MDSNTTISEPRQHVAFLALPPEIRNDICERLLVHRRPLKIRKGQSEYETRVVLDVCRQLKNEFSALYYSGNVFVCQCSESDLDRELDSTANLISWLKRIGPYNRAMLQEVQIRLVTKRTFTNKQDRFAFLRDQNVRITLEVGWLPLSVLKMRIEDQWLTQIEISELIVAEEEAEAVDRLDRLGSSLAKGPDLRTWKRDLWDPVIDRYSKPDKRPLSEFVCPANWKFYAMQEDPFSFWDGDFKLADAEEEADVVVEEKDETETGCLAGSIKVWAAQLRKVRRCKAAIVRIRRGRGKTRLEVAG